MAESKTGDYTPEKISKLEKQKIENSAFEEILLTLPEPLKDEYQKIWQEYVENNSEESKLIHQLDKLEMVLQAKIYEADGYSREKLETFLKSTESEITNPDLNELFTQIVQK